MTSTNEEMSEEFKRIYKLLGPGTSIGRNFQDGICFIKVRESGNLIKVGYGKNWKEALADVKDVSKTRH
jgi:hypothetical protein